MAPISAVRVASDIDLDLQIEWLDLNLVSINDNSKQLGNRKNRLLSF
jgi:hypothetical protein